jgi:hypothetical protein
MVNDVVANVLGLGVQLHNRLFQDRHLFVHTRLLCVHALGLGLGLCKGVLEHHELLVEALLFSFYFVLLLLKEFVFALAHTQLVVKAVGCLLLFASLVSHAGNFRLDL